MISSSDLLAKARKELNYDPESGKFSWICEWKRKRWPEVGAVNLLGYIQISLGDKIYYAHRLAWLMTFGMNPEDQIDHIDGNRANNRMANLREATNAKNRQNCKIGPNGNRTLPRGVYKKGKRFFSQIQVNKKQIRIGTFDSAEDAAVAYLRKRMELHPFQSMERLSDG